MLIILGKKFLLCPKLGSSISASDPESEDMLRISIIGILFLLETKLLEFASGAESEYIFNVLIIGDRHSEFLFSVNIKSVTGFFDSKFSGTDSIPGSWFFSKLRAILFFIYLLLFSNNCSNNKMVVSTHLYVFLLGSV